MPPSQPNVLLLMADQLAAPFLRAYGDTKVVSPAIDRLAGEGVVFTSAYCASPLCAPSRFSMLTGQLCSKIGAYDNASELASSVPTFAHHLRAAGYQTSLVGKMHFVGADQLHGFEERLTTDIYPADFGWTPDWADPDRRFDRWFHNMDTVVHAGVADVSNQLDFDDEVGFQTVRKLRDLARSGDERPWLLTASFTHPHDPYVARPQFWDLYDPDDVPLPTVGPIGDADLDPHSRRLRHLMAADATDVTADQVRNARHGYFAAISYVDSWIDQILTTLARHDLADDTVIVLTADHGDMLGERGLWYKMSFFESSARVPLIVHAPGRLAATTVDTHASLLDLAPTLLDLAGVEIPETMDGRNLLRLIGADDRDRTVVGEYLGEGAIAPVLMIRRGARKYVWSRPDPPLLFDLVDDPHELTNLAADVAHEGEVAAFEAEVRERWDPDALDAEVRASQRDRRVVDRALRQGRYRSWDFQPATDAANQYMRNHLDLDDVERSRRA